MNSIQASIRTTNTKGEVNALRQKGDVPAIIYGGTEENQKISISKKHLRLLIDQENFLSNIININMDGKTINALPREISYDPLSDDPIHIDFLRVAKGTKITLEIPVQFVNSDKSPGLKKGGVLNIVRRKVELKCPAENIPNELIVDLNDVDIGTSIKISSIKLPENVVPTITGRDFVVATLVSPTVVVEPEKVEETSVEGEAGAEAVTGDEATAATAEGEEKKDEGKDKSNKAPDNKAKSVPGDKETKKK